MEFVKLQPRVTEIGGEKMKMKKQLDNIHITPRTERAKNEAESTVKISELELVNSQLKIQLFELQNSINEGTGLSKLCEHLQMLQNELDRRNEEIIQLKSVLSSQTDNVKTIRYSKATVGEYANKDGKLIEAHEPEIEKSNFESREKDKLGKKFRKDNEKQQQTLSVNLTNTHLSQGEAFMQNEIIRLIKGNLDLTDKNNALNEIVRKLEEKVEFLTRKLKAADLNLNESVIMENDTNSDARAVASADMTHSKVKENKKEYLGMFSFDSGDEDLIMKHIVLELKPKSAVTLLPGLPSYIVFMCLRYADFINDEDMVKALLSKFANSVKKVIRRRSDNFEISTLWLTNTLRLLHNMKQYSGEEAFQKKNSPTQNAQSLRNFDLSEYRQVLSDTSVWIYHELIKSFKKKIQPLIVPAILEHEEIPGITGSKPCGLKGKGSLDRTDDGPNTNLKPTTVLLQEFTNHYKTLNSYAVDPEVISQVFKQVFCFVCALSLNNILLRKEMCNWSKGFQIRHNLSHFEMWTRHKNLDESAIQATLQPVIQVAYLLQARKTEEDVDSVYEMCSSLTPLQILKILHLYTPVDEFEERIPVSFIRKMHEKLEERLQGKQQALLMDIKYNFPVKFPFNPSIVCLEDIEIPDCLKLTTLKKI